jgi:tetratricopeptide (TPR) repeat protein
MNERDIFVAALDIDDPAARAAYLDEACAADPALRLRVEVLLAAATPGSFMARPAADLAPETGEYVDPGPAAAEPDLTGTLLAGRYLLGESIGEGGMGTVYRADQVAPVRRPVAVKLIKPGMDTKAVLGRFEAERQALAVMDHPHIAKVLDAGATTEGRPFFVMELVAGVPLTDYCDAHKLPVADRLDLFQLICAAVQHAHQKGVIHRDLKPGNILVGEQDGRPAPKVIDFGLAKAVGGAPLTDQTLLTAPGALAGTPLYMAPEQANGGPDIDTRADVYALGAILYELLTGSTPIRRDTLRRAALAEVLRLIREADPPTPSRRLGADDSAPSVAANRRTEPGRLGRFVRGDLDWVVMKALEKDRSRRYESAAAFAADVDRFLNQEPVAAGPPTRWYRAGKFVRRNRAVVTASGLVLLALVAGVIGTTWGLVRAANQRDRAEAATGRAERASDRAFLALDTLTEDALEELLGRRAVWGDRERAFLGKVRDQFEQLADAEGDSVPARRIRAAARLRLGSIRALLGDAAAAEADYRAAAAAFDELADAPDRLNGAQARRRLAALLSTTGRPAEAHAAFREAGRAFDQLAAEFPTNAEYRFQAALVRNGAGYVHYQAGEFEAAEADCRAAAAELGELATADPAHPRYPTERARALHNVFSVLRRTKRAAEAERTIDEAVVLLRAAAGSRQDPNVRVALAKALQSRCAILADRGAPDVAESVQREALAVHATLAADYPAVPDYRYELAKAQFNLAILSQLADRPDEALAAFRDAASTSLRLADDFPKVTEYRVLLARARTAHAEALNTLKRFPDAEAALIAAQPVWEKLRADAPTAPIPLVGLVNTLVQLGVAADRRKDHVGSWAHLEKAGKHRAASPGLMARDPDGRGVEQLLVMYQARTLVNLGHHAAAAARSEELAGIADFEGPDNAFNAGCYLARCSGLAAKDSTLPADRRKVVADDYAARAVGHLRTALARGFKDRTAFVKDADLAPLLGRQDYTSFLAGLK